MSKFMLKPLHCKRCQWVQLENPLSLTYHDQEWGVPVHDDCKHFEFLILEGALAGLNWHTILQRRKNYEQAFSSFNPKQVAAYDSAQAAKLLANEGIIRNKLKIASAIQNATCFLAIQREFGSFDEYVWQFVNGKPIQNHWKSSQEIPAETKESKLLSVDLKKRGFTFVGPTIMYAYMQAVGLVNDHMVDCFRYSQLK
jgi:DNA-3-methyladenine glycosylase I